MLFNGKYWGDCWGLSQKINFIVENNKQLKYGQIFVQAIRDRTVYKPESM